MLTSRQAKLRTVLLIGLLVIISMAWVMAGAGKGNGKGNGGGDPAINPPADVYVNDDFPSAKLLSDAGRVPPFGDGRWYHDGTDGVYALINNSSCDDPDDPPACNDGIFDPDLDAKQRDLRSGNTRYLNINLGDPAVGDCVGEEGGDVYCDAFGVGAFLNVDHMADVPVGGSATNKAIMHIPGGTLFFNPLVEGIAGDGEGNPCAWRVSLDALNEGGDVAALKVQSSPGEWIERGSYHFPFQLEFWLPNASSCNLVGP